MEQNTHIIMEYSYYEILILLWNTHIMKYSGILILFSDFAKFSHYHNCYHKVTFFTRYICFVISAIEVESSIIHMVIYSVLFPFQVDLFYTKSDAIVNSKQQNMNILIIILTMLCKDLFLEKSNHAVIML